MKKLIAAIFFLFSYKQSFSQQEPCTCDIIVSIKTVSADSAVSGKVIIEWAVDSAGLYSNPVVIQHLLKPYDDEALRAIKELIKKYNGCIMRCKRMIKQMPGKKNIAINFTQADEE